MSTPRLNHDATTQEDVYAYYRTRAQQLSLAGYEWSEKLIPMTYGFGTTFSGPDGRTYRSYYILAQHRGQGRYRQMLLSHPDPIVTVKDCHIAEYARKCGCEVWEIAGVYDSPEYELIQKYYGDKRAKRSQALLMDHIDQGVRILQHNGCSEFVQRAFCLHPIFQHDDQLKENAYLLQFDKMPEGFSLWSVSLALEYRSVANEYLSWREIKDISEIRLSPLDEVNWMLYADKVQNYTDFKKYHFGKHERSAELDKYFRNWMARLNQHFGL